MKKTTPTVQGFDGVFQYVNGRGKFQWLLLLIVSLQMMLLTFHHLGAVFIGAVPEHWCHIYELEDVGWSSDEIRKFSSPPFINSDGKVEYDGCHIYDWDYRTIAQTFLNFEDAFNYTREVYNMTELRECTHWIYDTSIYESTVVSEFDLVCKNRPWAAAIQSTYMAGVLFGSLFMATASDRIFGRRNIALLSVAMVTVGGFAAAFSQNYFAFIFFRFMIAMGVSGSFQNCYVLLLEYSDHAYRAILGVIEQLPFAIGYMCIPLYAYFIRDWFYLQLAFTVSGLVLISYIWILPESARWLASKGRETECMTWLEKVSIKNNRLREFQENNLKVLDHVRNAREEDITEFEISRIFHSIGAFFSNFWSLVKTPKLRGRSLALWFLFFAVTLVYYGLSFGSAKLTDDPYLLVFLGGLMEVPAYTLTSPIIRKFGRKPLVITGFLITGGLLAGMALIPIGMVNLRVVLVMLGKLCVSASFAVIYLLGAELYPTTLRNTGLGAAVIIGRFGSMTAPFLVDLKGDNSINLSILIFSATAFTAGAVAFTLPETKKTALPDNVQSVEKKKYKESGNEKNVDIPLTSSTWE